MWKHPLKPKWIIIATGIICTCKKIHNKIMYECIAQNIREFQLFLWKAKKIIWTFAPFIKYENELNVAGPALIPRLEKIVDYLSAKRAKQSASVTISEDGVISINTTVLCISSVKATNRPKRPILNHFGVFTNCMKSSDNRNAIERTYFGRKQKNCDLKLWISLIYWIYL